ncbi:hypothetical protein [Sessilibacter corallicola]|uniref:Holin n=1 Tax=Sessilibacter corallicola TaxID=2904075 RepID=A0ABQ0ACV3_9GAMM|nr:hypothetical protein [Sessilibacter corallicola]MCE2030069.1 hypothetical protein [Sessilibacter corallicola]
MTGQEFMGLIVGLCVIGLLGKLLEQLLRELYKLYKATARVVVGVAGAVGTYIFTSAVFGIPITELTWTGVATGVVLSALFPGASNGGGAPPA